MGRKESLSSRATYIHNSHGVWVAQICEEEKDSTIDVVHSILCIFLVQVDDPQKQRY